MERRINKLLKKTKSKILVILGDIKDEVPGINYPEMFDIPKFLSRLSEKVELKICKGNHDTYLEKIIPEKISLYQSGGFRINQYFFQHGHEWPSNDFLNCDYLISSHIHPTFEFKDKFGYRISKPVWIRTKVEKKIFFKKYKIKKENSIEIFVVPSFNPLIGGYPINKTKEIERISPILKRDFLNPQKTELYLLDGTYIGTLNEIMN